MLLFTSGKNDLAFYYINFFPLKVAEGPINLVDIHPSKNSNMFQWTAHISNCVNIFVRELRDDHHYVSICTLCDVLVWWCDFCNVKYVPWQHWSSITPLEIITLRRQYTFAWEKSPEDTETYSTRLVIIRGGGRQPLNYHVINWMGGLVTIIGCRDYYAYVRTKCRPTSEQPGQTHTPAEPERRHHTRCSGPVCGPLGPDAGAGQPSASWTGC